MWIKETQEKLKSEIIPVFQEEVWALNDYMAEHPELGSQEFEASCRIVKLLRQHGIQVEYPFGGLDTAFKGVINPGGKRKAAFLAEYDALPEIGHGCGHCASGMASVMAALALNEIRDELGDVQIDIVGTPDEELLGGKIPLVRVGVFDDYEFAAMVHMYGTNGIQVEFTALDALHFEYRGKPAHAAACPEKGRNALNAVRLLFDSVDMMRQHVIDSARIHGYIYEGGKASNVVPDYACAEIVTRAPRRADLDDITMWVKECGQAAAMATRTEVTISSFGDSFDSFETGPEKENLLRGCFSDLNLPLDKRSKMGGGSSDIANVDAVCPAFHPMMGIGVDAEPHTRKFAEAMTGSGTHDAIVNSARLLTELAYKMLSDPEQADRIRKEQRTAHGIKEH